VATKRNHALAYRKVPGFLRELRGRAGLTQADVGVRIGTSQVFVARCESGSRRVDVAEFIEIARALGLDPVEAFAELAKRK
jgi:transcriptional regulator with XRE-family HTH domain